MLSHHIMSSYVIVCNIVTCYITYMFQLEAAETRVPIRNPARSAHMCLRKLSANHMHITSAQTSSCLQMVHDHGSTCHNTRHPSYGACLRNYTPMYRQMLCHATLEREREREHTLAGERARERERERETDGGPSTSDPEHGVSREYVTSCYSVL